MEILNQLHDSNLFFDIPQVTTPLSGSAENEHPASISPKKRPRSEINQRNILKPIRPLLRNHPNAVPEIANPLLQFTDQQKAVLQDQLRQHFQLTLHLLILWKKNNNHEAVKKYLSFLSEIHSQKEASTLQRNIQSQQQGEGGKDNSFRSIFDIEGFDEIPEISNLLSTMDANDKNDLDYFVRKYNHIANLSSEDTLKPSRTSSLLNNN